MLCRTPMYSGRIGLLRTLRSAVFTSCSGLEDFSTSSTPSAVAITRATLILSDDENFISFNPSCSLYSLLVCCTSSNHLLTKLPASSCSRRWLEPRFLIWYTVPSDSTISSNLNISPAWYCSRKFEVSNLTCSLIASIPRP